MEWILITVAIVVARFISLFISKYNYKKLMAAGATEYGAKNSLWLALGHTLFYLFCFYEGFFTELLKSDVSIAGGGIILFSFIMLAVVIYQLYPFWTIKLVISPEHRLNSTWFFRFFRHPNYILNIIPELIGLCLLYESFVTLAVGLPIYLIPLGIRIRQEENIMRATFDSYA